MIDQNKWIKTLQGIQKKPNIEECNIDKSKWINTIPKNNSYNSGKKYFLISFVFIFGLILVSVVKNETKYLEKEINALNKKIYLTQFNLDQSILDHEVLTSPENISILATEYLNIDLTPYKKSQIKNFNKKIKTFSEEKKETTYTKKVNILSDNIKFQLASNIEKNKLKIAKLQKLYSDPKTLPNKIKKKKTELMNIYHDPKNSVDLKKVGKWSAIQVVKAFLGIPIVPGR